VQHRVIAFSWFIAAVVVSGQGCGRPSATPTGISITGPLTLTTTGQTGQLAAVEAFSDHTTQILATGVQWTSSDPSIATVSATGLVTAAGHGTINIVATYKNFTATVAVAVAVVTVIPVPPVTATGISISGSLTLTALGQTGQLTAVEAFSDHTTQVLTTGVQWTTSNPSVATVSATGLVTATGNGLVTIGASYQATSQTFTSTKGLLVALAVSSVKLTGNVALTDVGQTSQLTATATLPDGSTSDVTSIAIWTSFDTSIVTVSSNGLLSAVGLGAARVAVQYGGGVDLRGDLKIATVTPAGTFIAQGWVRHPGHGPVPGFRVLDTGSGRSVVTRSDGSYNLAGLTGSAHLAFDLAGFEPVELVVAGSAGDVVSVDVAVQPLIRITAGQTAQTTIAPKDLEYDVSPTDRCVKCQLIRVVSPASGTLHLKFTWNRPGVALTAWIAGQPFPGPVAGPLSVDVPVDAGELVLYVGVASGVIVEGDVLTLTVTTSFATTRSPGATVKAVFGNGGAWGYRFGIVQR
jgi:uncharacterized protein YjdB